MPIYEYRCDNGDVFDAMQSFSDEPLSKCEVCGAPVQRVMHAPAVHFKGNGFYSTDYKKKDAGSGEGSGPSKSASSDSSSKAESDKPAAAKPEKTETKSTNAG